MEINGGKSARTWLTVALIGLVCVASAPALMGSWVYDDRGMISSPNMSGFDDVLAAFARTSADYITGLWPYGVTYRPLSIISLVVVQAIAPNAPWLHHLLSLALHLAVCAGLYVTAKRICPPGAHARAAIATIIFALHPIAIEAYGWINGRSDVLAGAFLLALAASLPFGDDEQRGSPILATLSALGACLSKEPAAVAALALTAAAACPGTGLPNVASLRSRMPALLAAGIGVVAALGLRASMTAGQCSGSGLLLRDPDLAPALAKLATLTVTHILLPLPNAMLALSWELFQPITAADVCALALAMAALVALAYTRHVRALALVLGAYASLLPVVAVKRLVWMGFDRYVYIPLILLVLAAVDVGAQRAKAHRPLLRAVALAYAAALAVSTFVTAQAYADHETWLASMVVSRPDDPSGWIMMADYLLKERGRAPALESLKRAPRAQLPPPLATDLAKLWFDVGDPKTAREIVESSLARYPDDPELLMGAVKLRGGHYDFEGALQAAEHARRDPLQCPHVQNALKKWLSAPDLPERYVPRVRALASEPCTQDARCAAR